MHYSDKLIAKIENPRCAGFFTPEETRGLRLVIGKEEKVVAFYWLIDEEDGRIADAKFQAYGPAALIGAAEAACELLIHKNYDQARRISAELIEHQVGGFPESMGRCLNQVLAAIEHAADQCSDIPFDEVYTETPMASKIESTGSYPGWSLLSKEEKLKVIEEVIQSEIRPYIELDAGGVKIIDLKGSELLIAYQGSCTTCYSATGATLSAIQEILKAKVSSDLVVVPDLSQLQIPSHQGENLS
jgi:NifU-like protein